jgi:tetratricopeptide (TPR) repeat protein/predicted Ser/Thr protein kinase
MGAAPSDARLSNYRLERLLGAGGMGSVYLAHDLSLDRKVAIKFLNPEKAAEPAARRHLLREARAAAALDHPNICAVHQVIDEDGRTCIVMQFVEGETLAEILRRGPLEARFALSLACDLAEALAAAHRHGIIHRDLKPQNVMVTPDRRARLLDFGIARIVEAPSVAKADTNHTGNTTEGLFVGTLPYMSPEQAQQHAIDARSDLFSLGAVLYECLTGRAAFDGRTHIDIFTQLLNVQPPAVSAVRPELTDRYDEVCRRLLEKHPDDRFRSASELLGALRVLMPDTRGSTSEVRAGARPPRGWRRRRSWLAAAAVVLIVATAGVWKWYGADVPTADDEFYRRGTDYVRAGAYHSARLALTTSIEQFGGSHPQAHLRLAEAYSELDDVEAAQQALLTVEKLLGSGSRLSPDDRLLVQALRALLSRDLTASVAAYRALADRRPSDAGAWLDLGRAQEASALSGDARASYERAILIDQRYAAPRLRRASLLAAEGRRDEALAEFAEAEKLYRAASNVEGQVEVLLRRGAYLNGIGDITHAKPALEEASRLAETLRSRSQQIRAQIQLSSVATWEGRFSEAEKLAAAAVNAALAEGLDTVAADGLVDLASVLTQVRR